MGHRDSRRLLVRVVERLAEHVRGPFGSAGARPWTNMSASTPEDSGIASGMCNTMQQVGSAFGLAILSTLAASRTESPLGHGESAAASLTGGYRLAFGLGTVFTVAALVLAAVVLRTVRATRNTPAEPPTPTPADAGQAAALRNSAAG
ncbi:hypothetical protein QR77_24845 [Streptomyces sp. 150FB]|uniref:hypothetical protein n=1 Tax=Streptomyces sp. 150FB TaxID=1576605 RepID=UPI000589146F|nr:hypothetical protein [Streptomyces sp. 150FB]KIF76247.1 hypothetical protein QR77_24845 [Streptomyces sp. 150FB]